MNYVAQKHVPTLSRAIPTVFLLGIVCIISGCEVSSGQEFHISFDLTSLFDDQALSNDSSVAEYRLEISYFGYDSTSQIMKPTELLNVPLKSSQYQFTGSIDAPRVCDIMVEYQVAENSEWFFGTAIIGPASTLRVHYDVSTDSLEIEGDKWHQRLISIGPEPVAVRAASEIFRAEWEKFRAEIRLEDGSLPEETTLQRWADSFLDKENDTHTETTGDIPDNTSKGTCSSYEETAPNFEPDFRSLTIYTWPEELVAAYENLSKLEYSYLDNIARTSSEPWDRLLAIELGGLAHYRAGKFAALLLKEKLSVLDEIAGNISESLGEERVEIAEKQIRSELDWRENTKLVVPGKYAPEFSLKNRQGEDVSLESLVQTNEIVLLYAMAAWMEVDAQHIEALERLHNEFGQLGVAVVLIRFAASQDIWDSIQSETPWLNLASMADRRTWLIDPMQKNYGILGSPKLILIDATKCIMKLNPSFVQLESFLSAKLKDGSLPN